MPAEHRARPLVDLVFGACKRPAHSLGGRGFAEGHLGFHSAIGLPSRFRDFSRAVLSSASVRISRRWRCSCRSTAKRRNKSTSSVFVFVAIHGYSPKRRIAQVVAARLVNACRISSLNKRPIWIERNQKRGIQSSVASKHRRRRLGCFSGVSIDLPLKSEERKPASRAWSIQPPCNLASLGGVLVEMV
jgi:hypothetical protein